MTALPTTHVVTDDITAPCSLPSRTLSVFLSAKLYSVSGYVLPPTVTFVSRVSKQTDLSGEPFLWPARSFGTSCRSAHGLPAPTHRTVSSEHWRCSCFNEWTSCCSWQHLWATVTALEWGGGAIVKVITLTLTLWQTVMWNIALDEISVQLQVLDRNMTWFVRYFYITTQILNLKWLYVNVISCFYCKFLKMCETSEGTAGTDSIFSCLDVCLQFILSLSNYC